MLDHCSLSQLSSSSVCSTILSFMSATAVTCCCFSGEVLNQFRNIARQYSYFFRLFQVLTSGLRQFATVSTNNQICICVEYLSVSICMKLLCLQCFDAVGWAAGRACKNWVVGCWRGYLSGARCRLAYGPADVTATHSLASVKSRLVLPFWYRLTRVVPEKGR